jgi:hypothetical protein
MSTRKSFVLGCTAAFLAGGVLTQAVAHLTASVRANDDVPGIAWERGREGVVLRTTLPDKDFSVLVEAGREGEITFHQDSVTVNLRREATARIYDLRRVMECHGDICKPCQPGPSDACLVPPVPVPGGPGTGYQLKFLSARR